MDCNGTMSYQEPLSQRTIAVSISDHPGLGPLGLAQEHLTDAMAEIARHLLAMGARLMYGGDLRPDTDEEPGFTRILFELVLRHRRDADVGDNRPALVNVIAQPLLRSSVPPSTVAEYQDALRGLVEFVTLGDAGDPVDLPDLLGLDASAPSEAEWARGLTAMRRWSVSQTHARVVLGGRTTGFKGQMPGIAEETLYSLAAGQPLFLLGGFGGCARDVAGLLGLLPGTPVPEWKGTDSFVRILENRDLRVRLLGNGLSYQENITLASTPHIDEAVILILRGLSRTIGDGRS